MPARLRSKNGFQPPPLYSKKRTSSLRTKTDYRIYLLALIFILSISAIHLLLQDEPTTSNLTGNASQNSPSQQNQPYSLSPNSTNNTQNETLSNFHDLVPRFTQIRLKANREERRSLQLDANVPFLHAFLVCHCCIQSISKSLQSLIHQTIIPSKLTIVHECSSDQRNQIRNVARQTLADGSSTGSSVIMFPEMTDHQCQHSNFQSCVLHYLISAAETDNSDISILITEKVVLEPTAIEKASLSLTVRPHVASIQMLAYDVESLSRAHHNHDPLHIRKIFPSRNFTIDDPVVPIPLIYNVTHFRDAFEDSYNLESTQAIWKPFLKIVSQGRLIKEALYTNIDVDQTHDTDGQLFSLNNIDKERKFIPQHLFSKKAFYKWSSWHDEEEMYKNRLFDFDALKQTDVDTRTIPFWSLQSPKNVRRILFVLPWLQMGGSEKCMLDIANYLSTTKKNWEITFVLTMPFWHEDEVGEVSLQNQWIDRALQISSDTFDLLALGPNDQESRLFRYIIESRNPEFILMANSRWAYSHSSFIRAISPTIISADYNHMIHLNWNGGGLPRYGANNSYNLDLHLTASEDVASSMRKWIDPSIMKKEPKKVKACHIGTDPSLIYSGEEKSRVRSEMRDKLGIPHTATVILFAGRFVIDKGIDVAAAVAKRFQQDDNLSKKTVFLFVGSGDQDHYIKSLRMENKDGTPSVIIKPPALGIEELRNYYALSDILLLPSINEGIALVVYEAMAAGLLVVSTDVGGQKEIVTNDTGILLFNDQSFSGMTNSTFEKLHHIVENPETYQPMIEKGREIVRNNYTTSKFCECVYENLMRVSEERSSQVPFSTSYQDISSRELIENVTRSVYEERHHGLWNRHLAVRKIENDVTIGIKTYICDNSIKQQVEVLLRSIRTHYPFVRVLLGNDGPTSVADENFVKNDEFTEEYMLPRDCGISFGRNYMVNQTNTKFFLLLDDDHIFDDTTNLTTLVNGLRRDKFDIVGLRVRNLPGIDELERIGISIPRYVATIQKLENRQLTLCVWNENMGPSIYGITHPIVVDVLHNALIARTEVLRKHAWRNELKVNEHMTFFLDARDAKLRVGYLPSIFVHHRPRDYSKCYFDVRFREDKYRKLLQYEDQFLWDIACQKKFPAKVKDHIIKYELSDDSSVPEE